MTDDEKEVDVSDSDSLTDVTDDTMSCDSDLLSILGEEPRHETVTLPRKPSPQFNDRKDRDLERKDRDLESLDLNDLMIMFTEQESVAASKEQLPDYVLFMSLPPAEDVLPEPKSKGLVSISSLKTMPSDGMCSHQRRAYFALD